MSFSVVSWNMNHWRQSKFNSEKAWEFLFEKINPDIALIQEAVPPNNINNKVWRIIDSKNRKWGSGVISHNWNLSEITKAQSKYYSEEDINHTIPGSVAIASLAFNQKYQITAISCYGLIDKAYAQTTMHRIIADLIPLFDDRKLGKFVIFGGDLNIGTQQKKDMVERQRHWAILESIKSLRLKDCLEIKKDSRKPIENCPCVDSPTCGHVITHQHNKGAKAQNDYLFATPELSATLIDCYPFNETKGFPTDENGKWTLSDHCPIFAEFDLK